jgi:hypothetical protein
MSLSEMTEPEATAMKQIRLNDPEEWKTKIVESRSLSRGKGKARDALNYAAVTTAQARTCLPLILIMVLVFTLFCRGWCFLVLVMAVRAKS